MNPEILNNVICHAQPLAEITPSGMAGKPLHWLQQVWGCIGKLYYHWTTFLQLNTIRFLLPLPHPFIPSELSGSRRNESKSMSAFLFEDILPIICCNGLQNVLDPPFCNLWPEPPNSKSDNRLPKRCCIVSGRNQNKDMFMEQRMKILVVAMSFAPPSLKIIELWQLCFDLSWDSYIAYMSSNKVAQI